MHDAMFPCITDQAPKAPSQCLFSQDHEGPWIDTGLVAPWIRPHGYIGVAYVEELARDLLGMIPRKEVEAELEAMRERLKELEKRADEAQEFIDATIEYEEVKERVAL
jgi:hypothetical protein